LARAGNTGGDIACRRCKAALETIGHISGQCPAVKGYRINRHNGICWILSDRLKEKEWTVALEPKIKSTDGKTFIPDIIAVKDRKAVVIDPTIIYENSDNSLQSANKAKVQKYSPLNNEIKTLYGVDKVEFHGLAVGARGGWCSQNTKCLTSVGL
jgi:hypothetical protein